MLVPRDGDASAAGTDRQVAFTSMFWILLPIALNTMTQPGGSVLGTHPDINFMLRISPVVCVIDTFEILVAFVYLSLEHGTRQARQTLLAIRFKTGKKDEENEEFVDLQKSRTVRCILFLVTLIQAVRLYAFRGCMSMQIVASTYLASFVVMEALVIGRSSEKDKGEEADAPLLEEEREEESDAEHKESEPGWRDALTVAELMLAFCAEYYIAWTALLDALTTSGVPAEWVESFLLMAWTSHWIWRMIAGRLGLLPAISPSFGTILAVIMAGFASVQIWLGLVQFRSHQAPMSSMVNRNILYSHVYGCDVTVQIVRFIQKRRAKRRERRGDEASGVTSNQNSPEGKDAIETSWEKMTDDEKKRYRNENDSKWLVVHTTYGLKTAAWYFFTAHLVTTILYLKYSFQSENTWSPEWTDLLS